MSTTPIGSTPASETTAAVNQCAADELAFANDPQQAAVRRGFITAPSLLRIAA